MENVSPDPKTLSNSQFEKIIEDLKKSKNSDDMITALQFLQRFSTSDEKSTVFVLESGVLEFISETVKSHPDKKVKIHACAFLLTLSLSCGEFRQAFASETALSLLLNLVKESEQGLSLKLIKATSIQLSNVKFSTENAHAFVIIIEKMIVILTEKKTGSETKEQIIDFLTDLLDGETFIDPSSSSSSSYSSFSPSSSYPSSFLAVLSSLIETLTTLASTTRGRLRRDCNGLVVTIKNNFGVTEGKEIAKLKNSLIWSSVKKSSHISITDEGKTARTSKGADEQIVLLGDNQFTKGIITVLVNIKKNVDGNNGFTLGVIKTLPSSLEGNTFGRYGTILGWGLDNNKDDPGVFSNKTKVASSSVGFRTGDTVTMVVDVNKGNLLFKVNNTKCAEVLGEAQIQQGVYLAANFTGECEWMIQSVEYVERV